MKLGFVLIYVSDLSKTLDFYQRAFGLKTRFVNQTNQYAEMANEAGIVLGFVQENYVAKYCVPGFRKNENGKDPAGFEIAFITENLNESLDKALKAGAQLILKPTQKPWGQTVAYVTDINGVLVEICGPIGDAE